MAAEIEIVHSGSAHNALNGKLFTECIKFLLYERQQLPVPFHDLKRLVTEPSERTKASVSRKANQSFSDLLNLFGHLDDLFLSARIASAVIIFGSTAVSPKESFLLEFPESNMCCSADHDCLSDFRRVWDSACRKLIRSLISDHNLRMFKDIAPTSMLIFVQVNRTDSVQWFRPKTSFKLPSKGEHCRITVRTEQEPVEQKERTSDAKCNEDEEYIWFQAPLNIRGYKERASSGGFGKNLWT